MIYTAELPPAASQEDTNSYIRWHTHKFIGTLSMLYINHGGHNYPDIEQHFDTWLNEADRPEDRLIRCEGRVPASGSYTSPEAAKQSDRTEVGWLAFMAERHDINMKSFEPSVAQQFVDLDVSADDYWFYLVGRRLPQAIRALSHSDIGHVDIAARMQDYTEQTISDINSNLGDAWSSYDLGNFAAVHATHYPERELDLTDTALFSRETIDLMPQTPETAIHTVARLANHHREAYASNLLMQDMKDGKQVFSLMGNPHVMKMETVGSVY
jgi:hypothetical protein